MKDGKYLQEKMPLLEAIEEYNRIRPAYFCIPGHRYEKGINGRWRELVGDAIFRFDLTETPLTDDLHSAEGAIQEAESLAARLFGADETHFLVNGTTCGNQIMVLTAAFEGQKIAVPRNAHKSMLMGLIMGGARPVYIMPELLPGSGLHGGITPAAVEAMFRENPDCRAVIAVSPTYYGLCSDLREIGRICHDRGALLLVDEAHGAHCYFSDLLPEGALAQGADMCSQSIHKVAGSLTQSSMLHVRGDRVDRDRMRANLHLVQSTSPSYLLMTSLDAARQDLALSGAAMAEKAVSLAEYAREEIRKIPGMSCMGREVVGQSGVSGFDSSRLTFGAWELGLTGFDLKQLLWEQGGCDTELADYKNVLAIFTFANDREDADRLVGALRRIAADCAGRRETAGRAGEKEQIPPLPPQPEYVLSPREAYFSEKKRVSWSAAEGLVAGEMIAPYPPGIPVIYPGERISPEVWAFIETYRRGGRHFHGPSDLSLETVLVI